MTPKLGQEIRLRVAIGAELAIGQEEHLVDGGAIGQLIDEHTRHGCRTLLNERNEDGSGFQRWARIRSGKGSMLRRVRPATSTRRTPRQRPRRIAGFRGMTLVDGKRIAMRTVSRRGRCGTATRNLVYSG